jgi:hypothetical protein
MSDINVTNLGATSNLGATLLPSDVVVRLTMGQGARFPVPIGTHFYLTVREGNAVERLRVTSRAGDLLAVARGQDGTTPMTFSRGACVSVEWNPAQLCEFVAGCQAVTITPGTTACACGSSQCTCNNFS